MPAAKTLLTGPFGADVRGHLLRDRGSSTAPGLWLVPTPLAKAQVLGGAGRRRRPARGRLGSGAGRTSGGRSVRVATTDRAGSPRPARGRRWGSRSTGPATSGVLSATAAVATSPGFRRRVRERIARLVAAGPLPRPRPARNRADGRRRVGDLRPVPRRAQDAGRRGRRGVRQLGREVVGQGQRRRASKTLGVVTVLNPDGDTPAVRRALEFFEANADEVRVVLGYDPDPSLADAFSAVAPLRAGVDRAGVRGIGASPPTSGGPRP